MNSPITRRKLFGVVGLTAASYLRIPGANDRVRTGHIGLGPDGLALLAAFERFGDGAVAVSDVCGDSMELAAARLGRAVACQRDYRRVLDDRQIDAVIISAPIRMRAGILEEACRAGKDAYVETP